MRRTPLFLGAVSIVFGVLTAALMLFALFAAPAQTGVTAEQRHYQIVSTTTFGVMAFALIIVGIGLARRRRWARAAGIAWGIAGIAVVEFEFYALGRVAGTRTSGMYVMMLLETIFPLTMLVLLARRSAKDDFV